jgi:hypothetical protein
MKLIAMFLTLVLPVAAYAQDSADPEFCKNPNEGFGRRDKFESCVAAYARRYEISGDTAESVATAAITMCASLKKPIADYFTQCLHVNGADALAGMEQPFHDFAVLAVVNARAERLAGKTGRQ